MRPDQVTFYWSKDEPFTRVILVNGEYAGEIYRMFLGRWYLSCDLRGYDHHKVASVQDGEQLAIELYTSQPPQGLQEPQ